MTLIHAYSQDHRNLLTQPADPEIGVTTSDGTW
jgi:hypothetical protein